MLRALGLYALILPAIGLLTFLLARQHVPRSRKAEVSSALVLLVPLPVAVAVFAVVKGTTSSFSVIAASEAAPKPAEVYAGIGESLVVLLAGLVVSVPTYLLAVLGLIAHVFERDAPPPQHEQLR